MCEDSSRGLHRTKPKFIEFKDNFQLPFIPTPLQKTARRSKKDDIEPTGRVVIHFCGNPGFELDYFDDETVADFRERISENTEVDMKNFNIVSKNGTMEDHKLVKEYEIEPMQHIIIIERQAHQTKMLETRHNWLEHKKRRSVGAIKINTEFLKDIKPKQRIPISLKDNRSITFYKSTETFAL